MQVLNNTLNNRLIERDYIILMNIHTICKLIYCNKCMYDKCILSMTYMHCETFEILPSTAVFETVAS